MYNVLHCITHIYIHNKFFVKKNVYSKKALYSFAVTLKVLRINSTTRRKPSICNRGRTRIPYGTPSDRTRCWLLASAVSRRPADAKCRTCTSRRPSRDSNGTGASSVRTVWTRTCWLPYTEATTSPVLVIERGKNNDVYWMLFYILSQCL